MVRPWECRLERRRSSSHLRWVFVAHQLLLFNANLIARPSRMVSFWASLMGLPCDCDQVQKSPIFRRDGADIHSDLYVSVAQAILGGTARTQGLYETLNLSVSRNSCYPNNNNFGQHFKHIQCNNWLDLSLDPYRHPDRPEDPPVREGNCSSQWLWLWRSLHPRQN